MCGAQVRTSVYLQESKRRSGEGGEKEKEKKRKNKTVG
jgi:hypothetical protein